MSLEPESPPPAAASVLDAELPLETLLTPGSQLAPEYTRALIAAFGERQDEFARAIASGGPRETFSHWQASHAALDAALTILRAASAADAP